MDTLRVRVYNVRFGDAILVSVPDRTANGGIEARHILIDVGNVLSGKGGDDAVFSPVIKNILEVLDGRPLDLYVMTHEHIDHVQGLPYADQHPDSWQRVTNEDLRQKLQVQHAWLTGSAKDDYYDEHPDANKHRLEAEKSYYAIKRFLLTCPEQETPWIRALMTNNDPGSTNDCVKFLRNLAKNTSYVHRGFDLEGKHPFHEARFVIWAPEEDTSVYYGRFRPMTLGVALGEGSEARPTLTVPTPPPGVDAGAFYNLVEIRRRGYVDNLLAIDAAANNTSVVFSLEWRGWRLVFAGDAEVRSWKMMNKEHMLKPVHFLKVSHHGSHNGMPPAELLERILPVPPDNRRRCAVVSTYPGTYDRVPDEETLTQLRRRCELYSTSDLADGMWKDINFEA